MTVINIAQVNQRMVRKRPPVCFASSTAGLSGYPLQANHPKQKQTPVWKEFSCFLQQIIKLQLHGAAFVMGFSLFRVIIQDPRMLKQ